MSKFYIDVTELVNWEGRLTGVPRVMFELSVRFSKNKNIVFVAWDSSLGVYNGVNFKDINGKFGKNLKKRYKMGKILKLKKITNKVTNKNNTLDINNEGKLLILSDWHGSDVSFINHIKQIHSSGVKIYQISYDMLPIITPQYSGHATDSFTKYAKEVYPLCEKLFAISQNTRKDIKEWLDSEGLSMPELDVIRLGDDFSFDGPVKPKGIFFEQNKEFLLNVGTIESRKNHTLLYYVYKLAHQKSIELPKIVIVGRRGWHGEEVYNLISSDPEIKDKFEFLESASDSELSWLYEHCTFTIYQSFYEGWGLPISESLARGVPCACSNTSSMPEIAGNIPEYFNPYSTDECLKAISNLLDTNKRNTQKAKIKRYKLTSWDDTFAQIYGKVSSQ